MDVDTIMYRSHSATSSSGDVDRNAKLAISNDAPNLAVAALEGEVNGGSVIYLLTPREHNDCDTEKDGRVYDDDEGFSYRLDAIIDGDTNHGGDWDEDEDETDERDPPLEVFDRNGEDDFMICEDLDGDTLVENCEFEPRDDVSDSGSNKENSKQPKTRLP